MLIRRIRGDTASLGFSREGYNLIDDGSIGYRLNSFIFAKASKGSVSVGNFLLDDFALAVLKYFVKKEKISLKVKGENYFNPLYLISKEEATAFLRSKGIKYADPVIKDELSGMLSKLEEKRPGAMISMVKIGIAASII
ncbi:MAG: hypothetical protein ACP5MT_02405 [Candidatus Acidifodinimicrobium sp.]